MTDTPATPPAGQPPERPAGPSSSDAQPVEPSAPVTPPPPGGAAAQLPQPTTGAGDGGTDIEAGRDVTVSGDVAGRDIINTSQTGVGTQNIGTVRVGWSEQAVTRLVLVVGALVFVTAACFFSGGLAVGGIVFAAFRDRPLDATPEQAQQFQQRLDALDGVQSGESFSLLLSEDELNAFVRYTLGPQIGFAPGTGAARLIDDNGTNLIAVRGDYEPLGGMPVVATFTLTDTPGAPLHLTGAAARIFGSRDGGPGWIYVPVEWLRTVEIQVNGLLGNVELDQAVVEPGSPDGASWEVTGSVR